MQHHFTMPSERNETDEKGGEGKKLAMEMVVGGDLPSVTYNEGGGGGGGGVGRGSHGVTEGWKGFVGSVTLPLQLHVTLTQILRYKN